MRSDNIRLMTVAIAVSVPQDEVAFEMLQQDYITDFTNYYDQKRMMMLASGQKGIPTVLDEMINFAIRELPVRVPSCQSLSDLLTPVRKWEITTRFLTQTMSQMLTSLAKRDSVRAAIRAHLHIEDRYRTHSAIDSTKFDTVYTDFMRMFEESSAASYRFEGTFIGHVRNTFINYYYKGSRMDTWYTLNAVDFAKREMETSIGEVKVLSQYRTDDILIHELVINIAELNDLMFNHSGQTEDARGVCYDAFYMILVHLCREKVDKLNPDLDGFKLYFVDERDREKSRNGLSENKGIASKIKNARMLLPVVFDAVRQGRWNLDNIMELRDYCFTLGKKDRDGKNCVWWDVQAKAETSRYFDTTTMAHNYEAFDKILRGMLSVYALMKALEDRGHFLVDVYNNNPNLFEDKRLGRSIDYLSALSHSADILRLQEEGEAMANPEAIERKGPLYTFNQMVKAYSGSELNNHGDIRTNRYQAKSRGLLGDEIHIKQNGPFQTQFEKLSSISKYLSAIPRGYEEYALLLHEDSRLPVHYAPEAVLAPSDVVGGQYHSLYSNRFMTANPDLARYYLYDIAKNERELQPFEWHIGNSLFTSVNLVQNVQDDMGNWFLKSTYCLYVPMVDVFLLCPTTDGDAQVARFPCKDLRELQTIVVDSVYNGRYNAGFQMIYGEIPPYIFNNFIRNSSRYADARVDALEKSLAFDTFLGFENVNTSDTLSRLKTIDVYHEYAPSMAKYTEWLACLSRIQYSFIELLQCIMSYGLLLATSSMGGISGYMEGQGGILVRSLLTSEFTADNLNWFFNDLFAQVKQARLVKVDMRWGTVNTSPVEFTPVDLSVLDIIANTSKKKLVEGTFEYDMYSFLSEYTDCATRFVQLYNFLNTRLTFLRIMRDAYEMVFNVVMKKFVTFCCEINSRFNIEKELLNARDSAGVGGIMDIKYALIDTLSIEDILRSIDYIRQSNWQSFSVIGEGLLHYFKDCRDELYQLSSYDIASDGDFVSKFQEYGDAFSILGGVPDPLVVDLLQDMRARLRVDKAGFFMCRSTYFKGRSGNSEFYIHYTGRMLEVTGSQIEPKDFDFRQDIDRRHYEEIIREGKASSVW